MILRLGNVWTEVLNATDEETSWLASFLTFDDGKNFVRVGGRVSYVPSMPSTFLSVTTRTFPAGLTRRVKVGAEAAGMRVDVLDSRVRPAEIDPDVDIGWLRDYQRRAVDACVRRTRGIVWSPTASGKCLGRGTPVLLHDGKIVSVEQVRVGDILVGPDNTPRKVLRTSCGVGSLFRIIPHRGEPWVCNGAHVLTLIHTSTNEVVDIPLDQYLRRSASWKYAMKLFRSSAVDFNRVPKILSVDPYFLGIWYGDGRRNLKQGVCVAKPDVEIEAACRDEADRFKLSLRVDRYKKKCPTYRIVSETCRGCLGGSNLLLNEMRSIVKNIDALPASYLYGPRNVRASLLAGLIDTDGYVTRKTTIEIVQERHGLARDIAFLARSLGLYVSESLKVVNGKPYARLYISGDFSSIPTRIARKTPTRAPTSDPLRTGFHIESIGEGEYFGFTLSGDGRFLLGDFTVTHNTESFVALALAVPCSWLLVVNETGLLTNAADRWEARTGFPAGRIGDGKFSIERFTVASFQSLRSRLKKRDPATINLLRTVGGLIVDECHTLPSDSYYRVSLQCDAYYRIGFSGTPLARGDKKSIFAIASLGDVIERVTADELIEQKFIAKPKIEMVPFAQSPAVSMFGTFDGAYSNGIVKNSRRNDLVARLAAKADPPMLVFVRHVKHGHDLTKRLRAAGLRTEFVWGDTSSSSRDDAIRRLRWGDLDAIVCSVVFQTGVDIPEVATAVNAAGMRSVIATIQRVGRGMRIVKDSSGNVVKGSFRMVDVADRGDRWLSRHADERRKAYVAEGYEVVEVDPILAV